jgi:hypothetical protein
MMNLDCLGQTVALSCEAGVRANQLAYATVRQECLVPFQTGTQVQLTIDPLRSYVLPIKS